MKNHFIISYFGNKREEVKLIYESIKNNIEDKEFIIEPFCGSSALSYYISLQHPNKYTYVLNDNNQFLIKLYNICKDDNLLNNLCEKLNEMYDIAQNKEDYLKISKKSKDDYICWLYIHLFYCIRPGLFPTTKIIKKERINNIKKAPIINFLKTEKIEISCDDWKNIYNKFKDNKKAFMFFDPPYLSSCNSHYMCPDVNIYENFYNNNICLLDSTIYLCLENIWIIKLLFKDYQKIIYDKMYQPSKKNTSHILVLNKKII
jgi:site-specific DNA-adenine methylase